ncbi:MAG: hypothetical protein NTY40_06220 [Synechococcus sp. LacPavin_0920_WC12_MAG_50_7]|nr:hypothetical protein [Synechococcus sp. LacPavin_0920_WC12_MAG_50_7]
MKPQQQLIIPLFPVAIATAQLQPDPLDTARLLQQMLLWRGDATGNSQEGCAWTGDLHGLHQFHLCEDAAWLVDQLANQVAIYLKQLGFKPGCLSVHIQRSWPVISDPGQLLGCHHHPNAQFSMRFDLVLTAPPGPTTAEYLPPHPSLWVPLRQDGLLMP